MDRFGNDRERLLRHLPEGTATYVAGLLAAEPLSHAGVEVHLVPSRSSKLGDHIGPVRGRRSHRITINDDLNPYAFLTTLLHEVAHALTWERHERFRSRYARRVRPHGPQWKEEFSQILAPVVVAGSLPADVTAALARFLRNPRASSCADRGLVVALSRYDPPDPSRVLVEDLPLGSLFHFGDGRAFRKGPKLRSRHLCFDVATGDKYYVNGLCDVVPCAPRRAAPVVTGRRRRA